MSSYTNPPHYAKAAPRAFLQPPYHYLAAQYLTAAWACAGRARNSELRAMSTISYVLRKDREIERWAKRYPPFYRANARAAYLDKVAKTIEDECVRSKRNWVEAVINLLLWAALP